MFNLNIMKINLCLVVVIYWIYWFCIFEVMGYYYRINWLTTLFCN